MPSDGDRDDPARDAAGDPAPPERASGGEGLDRRAFLGVSLTAIPAVRLAAAGLATAAPRAGPERSAAVALDVNGRRLSIPLDPRTTLLDALRERLELPGTKKGCDQGQCGACTVLIDGRRALSCLTLAVAASGRRITTIEGLARGDRLHPVQEAFIRHDAFQCGYCTPGQIVSAVGLLSEGCPADPAAVRECMSGNICRCGAYPGIVAAVLDAREKRS